jgi:hypothetical protein
MRAERSDGTAAKGADGGGVIFVGARARGGNKERKM